MTTATRRTLLQSAFGLGAWLSVPPVLFAQTAPRWRVPEESEPHELTFMQWPVSRDVHPDRWFLDDLQSAIARVANAIGEFEPVVMLAAAEHHAAARRKLSNNVELWDIPTEDLWARDSGPLFVTDGSGRLAVQNMNFNGWGGKQVHRHDGQVAARVAERLGLPLLDSGLVGEPGGIEFDGHGTIIAHASCWDNPNRNPGLSPNDITQRLEKAYGADKVVWAPGIKGQDITDDHIDSFARFTAPGKLLVQLPSDNAPYDDWWRRADESLTVFESANDANGNAFEITIIQDPWDTRVQSDEFVAAYVNYYVCNGAVIMAQFGDRDADDRAKQAITRAYPNRQIITLNADSIGEVGGGIHCATQQMPEI